MATPFQQNRPSFLSSPDSQKQSDEKPASPFAAREKPESLYKAKQSTGFGQPAGRTAQPSAFSAGQTASPFSTQRQTQKPAFGAQQPASTFGTARAGQTSAFGTNQQSPFAASRIGQQSTFTATRQTTTQPGERPFASLRSQSCPQQPHQTTPIFQRFQKPAETAGAKPSTFGQTVTAAPTGTTGIARQPIAGQARSTSPFRKDLHISDEEFLLLRDFIYQQCGIFIAENRKYLVENRLSSRLKELNLKSYNEYYNFLRFDNSRGQELTKLFEVVTTNETSFFRNPPQLEVFQRVVLQEAIEQCRKTGQKRLRIWSAGCSTGEEPYTLAIILSEALRTEIGAWDIKITANDLSEAVLAAARQGIYSEYALRTTPPEMVSRYFKKEGNVYKIDPALKRMVSFGQINLSDREQLKRVEKSQIVFCRNVIIYFDDEMKRKVINAFYDNLQPGGVLIIGHSESLHNISRAFQLEHHKGTILYRKLN